MENMDPSTLQKLDQKSFFKRVMERPGLHVGGNHLDYLQCLVDGYFWGSQGCEEHPPWNANYEIQHWLFHTQGAILQTTSWNGWTLFYRCFGTSTMAVSRFAELLHADIPPSPYPEGTPYHETGVSSEMERLYRDIGCGEVEGPTEQEVGAALLETVSTLLEQEGCVYDEVRIYIHKEWLCTQLRFIYHTPGGWRDDSAIIARPENRGRLVKLHALLACCPRLGPDKMERNGKILYSHVYGEDAPTWNHVIEMHHDIRDEQTLWHQYNEWRTHFSASY